MKNLFSLIFIYCSTLMSAQQPQFQKGETIDSLRVNETSKESYALYLPKSYDPTKLSSVVFIFEPGARGKIGIYNFIKASEKYGHILVCSNDSRNGPYERNFGIANRLFTKIFSDFSIDQKRVYTSGFSGGARLATTIAVLTEQIQGVVACAAAFSLNKSQIPYKDSFSFVGIVGDEDMNFKEMHNSREFLVRLKIPNELFVYEINHRWPNQEQILMAFDWLHLEALRKGVLPDNQEDITKIYYNYYEKAVGLEKNNRLLDASNELLRIERAFGKHYRLDSINTKLATLKNSKAYKKEKKALEANFKEEIILSDKFIDKFNEDFNKQGGLNMKWWRSEIKKLKKGIASANSGREKMLKRVLYKIFALSIESATLGGKIKHINQSIFCYDVCILVYPKYGFPYFKQMENYININKEAVALDYLEKLLNNGYDDLGRIKEYKPFKSLSTNERFKQLTKTN